MNEITNEIQEILKKNLPQQVGEVLQSRLKQADSDASELVKHKGYVTDRDEAIKKLQAEIQKYMAFDTRNAELEKREKAVAVKENEMSIKELTYQLESEKDKTKFSREVAMGLVRNVEYRKSLFDTQSQGGYSHGNDYIQPSPINKTLDETKTAQ